MIWLLIEVPVAGWNVRFSQMDNDLKCTEKGSQEFLRTCKKLYILSVWLLNVDLKTDGNSVCQLRPATLNDCKWLHLKLIIQGRSFIWYTRPRICCIFISSLLGSLYFWADFNLLDWILFHQECLQGSNASAAILFFLSKVTMFFLIIKKFCHNK